MRNGSVKTSGFSHVEVLLVVLIISILGAIAFPRYVRSISRYRALGAARRVAADLGYARDAARNRSAQRTVVFDRAAASYRIDDEKDLDRRAAAWIVRLTDEPYSSRLTSVELGGDETIVFNGHGVPDSGGTIVVRSGDVEHTVTVDPATGRAVVK